MIARRPAAKWRRVHRAGAARAAAFDAAPAALAICRGDGRVLALNPAAGQMFSRVAGRRLSLSDLVAPAPGDVRALAAQGGTTLGDGRRADGSTFPAEVALRRIGGRHGTLFAASIRDLSARCRDAAESARERRRLEHVEKLAAMESLLAGVAHELNNPLAILVAQATVLRDRAPDADVERRAERIAAAAQRAGRIVKGFLAMARQRAPVRERLAVNAAVEDALELVGHGFRSAGIDLRRDLAASLPDVEADRDLIGQVLVNLLLNAQEAVAGREGARLVTVRTAADDRGIGIEVSDTGAGVPAEIAERIFDPCFTTKPSGTGLGVGLSLCRSILAAHDGTVTLRASPDGGALFRVALPAVPARPGQAPGEVATGRSLSVLVVDDEGDVAESLAELIALFGHRVQVETSAVAALDLVRERRFDGAFADFHMPGLDGLALRRAVAAIDPALAARTVIVTGDTLSRRCGALHPDPAMTALRLDKPFTAQDVRLLLDRIAGP